MPMGCASSCRTFETFSTALQWVAQKHLNIAHLIHILDDYLMAASSYDQCCTDLKNFLSLCEYLGVPIAPEKTVGLRTTLTFAGIELDTIMFEARLPADKITKSKALLSKFLQRKKATLKEVQSLIGLLNFACSVVVPGRAFLRCLIDLTKDIRCASHFIRLVDLSKRICVYGNHFWMISTADRFFLGDFWSNSVNLNLYTDSTASLGFGAIFGQFWCFLR